MGYQAILKAIGIDRYYTVSQIKTKPLWLCGKASSKKAQMSVIF